MNCNTNSIEINKDTIILKNPSNDNTIISKISLPFPYY